LILRGLEESKGAKERMSSNVTILSLITGESKTALLPITFTSYY